MSADPWSRLAAPFPMAALAWHVLARSDDRGRLRLAPRVAEPFLRRRLDDVVGPAGWSLRLRAWGEDGLIAELTVAGATRGAAVRGPRPPAEGSGADTGDAAFSAAAAGFGMLPPVEVADDGWVDADPETDEPLHPPETRPRGAGEGVPPSSAPARAGGGGASSAAGFLADEVEGAAASGSPPPGGLPPEAAADRPAAGPGASGGLEGEDGSGEVEVPGARTGSAGEGPGGATGGVEEGTPEAAPAGKPEAHRVIDRLVERLREEGLGADAAKLVLSYGGYGRDPERSRELYARLRTLLIERGTHA